MTSYRSAPQAQLPENPISNRLSHSRFLETSFGRSCVSCQSSVTEGEVVGFINCGCAHEVEMSYEEFKELPGDDPNAPSVVIVSVVVDPAHQAADEAVGALI